MISRIDRRPRKNGKVSWRVRVEVGRDGEGKRVFDSHTFETKGEANDFLTDLNAGRRAGSNSTAINVDSYLDEWLKTVETTRTYYTYRRYKTLVKPIREAVGKVRLDKLTAAQLEAVYAPMYATHSARSVLHAHGAIRAALNRAVKQKLIP